MTVKRIFKIILKIATFIIIFIVSFGAIGYLFDSVGIIPSLWDTIFWGVLCILTAIKIMLIKEDF